MRDNDTMLDLDTTLYDHTPTVHSFWGVIEYAWSRVQENGIRADILATFLSDDDLYHTSWNKTIDDQSLRDLVDEANELIPFFFMALSMVVAGFDEPARMYFREGLHQILHDLNKWDGHSDSPDEKRTHTRCWVVIMGREIYHTLRANPITYKHLHFVQDVLLFGLLRSLHSDCLEPEKRRRFIRFKLF
ncbi:hypothetical protein CC85DRAFT_301105 [Cutaneotrichosporon oleaginosum]|uniref:Uncharacterized protein n=1 Tax=Cutaneotrichosporon oleaginosum TaxID=879819 RepID=A0A0J0XRI7_9TREE|nr:uncharacterized protein CC85DRAFT_301105 [Cutaneotrichosporon oleaginosum]KLT43705.1 hypothetical protein CC85DRAFT_301105 [Cutaneotrichosporon oleaginosum]TXT05123.1 hypothetical protein COLE_06443 [Cutaneotrichosporon oleaginosum]